MALHLWLARALFLVLSLFMACTVIYTCATDGSPFRWEVLTPWMGATLIDFYFNVFIISCWVCYKESSWLERIFWVLMLICLGSIFTLLYLAVQLFKLQPSDPLFFILLRERHARLLSQEHLQD
eukprot:TRINITY_DN1207_c1_g1_i1.p1 TRINITY_DN1207_c1_g1~~TRINITY_DN1207_c1_g1_i1.p1  ORF type:complete len:124 (-),score=23.26 TRINITY_DN1207_c1_g1_i1:151-522(-)